MSELNGTKGFGGRNRWRVVGWGTALLLLLVPFIAMQFTDEVNWTVFDFLIFGAMLLAAGGAFETAAKISPNNAYRAAAAVALLAAFLLIWVNGAVGIIGDGDNPANLMYIVVLAAAVIGVFIARRRPSTLALAMLVTAILQALVAVIAMVAGLGNTFVITVLFVALWLTSAWLFKKSA